jgi:hypothetical protein
VQGSVQGSVTNSVGRMWVVGPSDIDELEVVLAPVDAVENRYQARSA